MRRALLCSLFGSRIVRGDLSHTSLVSSDGSIAINEASRDGSITVDEASRNGSGDKRMSVPSILLGGELGCKRILHGLWQTSGGWGSATPQAAVQAMSELVAAGYTTFDLADHYGPAEDYIGMLQDEAAAGAVGPFNAYTKWVPQPETMTKAKVEAAIDRSLARMKTRTLDLMQFHWWDYASMGEAIKAMRIMDDLRKAGKIRQLGVTNFDTDNLKLLVDAGIPIVSNQVQFSLVDMRPAAKMGPYCEKQGIKLLTYGTLCGGLLTDKFLGVPEPRLSELPTPSMRKYFRGTIAPWGGWALFQELLRTLRTVADRHGNGTTIANVATKFILDQPSVGGVIIGLRAGVSEHAAENARTFALTLSDADRADIRTVVSKGKDLMRVIGDCGDEYRG